MSLTATILEITLAATAADLALFAPASGRIVGCPIRALNTHRSPRRRSRPAAVELDGWAPREGRWTVQAARALSRPKRLVASGPPKFKSAGLYVAHCRRAHSDVFGTCPSEGDGRLIAVGWNHFSPTEWATKFADFDVYWNQAALRPWTVGSCHNPTPEAAFRGWRECTPPWIVRPLEDWEGTPKRARSRSAALLIGRALARFSISRLGGEVHWGADALQALGHLCPELQTVAVDHVVDGYDVQNRPVVRSRDLDWAAVAQTQRDLSGPRGLAVRVALAIRKDGGTETLTDIGQRAIGLLEEAGLEFANVDELASWLAPSFSGASLAQATTLCQGVTPHQLAGRELTRREAHQWLSESPHVTPLDYIRKKYVDEGLRLPFVRSITLLHWLVAVKRREGWGQLTKERRTYRPGGEIVRFTFLDRVDEVQDADLVRGERTGVVEAFEAIGHRLGQEHQADKAERYRVLAPLPRGWRLFGCMKHLNTLALLQAEGERQHQCVGGYANAVERGRSVLLAIDLPRQGLHSTVELSPEGSVFQHRSAGNEEPAPQLERVLVAFCRRRI